MPQEQPQVQQPSASMPQALTKKSLDELEKEAILQALIEHRGIQTKAAAQLGMSARQIGYKMKKYGIEF
jgi:Nif-specific regulatory protein